MKKNIAIIAGSFHKPLVIKMVDEAKKVANATGLRVAQEVWVPGSLEKPLMVKKLLQDKKIHGVVVLGIIERGKTKHGLVMGISVISAIIQLQLEYMKPVGVGILGPEILPEQIPSRLIPYAHDAVQAVKTMVTVLEKE